MIALRIPNFWRNKNILSFALSPLSLIYWVIISIKKKFTARYIPKVKIISVGNVTVGGAGKTPVVIAIHQLLKATNKKIAVLSRGYKGKLKGPVQVSKEHKLDEVGDEALMLQIYSDVFVAKNRLDGIKYLEQLGYEIIITDDGLQDETFQKSLNILVVDSYFGFGNQMMLPSGPLRESISQAIKKADLIAVVGDGPFRIKNDDKLIEADFKTSMKFNHNKYIAFAGIGNPNKFFLTLKKVGANLIEKFSFADHYNYSDKEIENLIDIANQKEAILITTHKDFMRIKEEYRQKINYLPINLSWRNSEILNKKLSSL